VQQIACSRCGHLDFRECANRDPERSFLTGPRTQKNEAPASGGAHAQRKARLDAIAQINLAKPSRICVSLMAI
jgi:hypothetical protein